MTVKRIILFILVFLIGFNIKIAVNAGLIDSFEEITFENPKHKLIVNYKESELKKYYPKVNKRMFVGWRTYELTKSSKVDFIQTTILSIRNEGSTPIIREQSTKVERTQKYAISASSSLSGAISGNLKGFKLGLDRKINIKADATITISQVENQSTKITIDPMTMLNIYVIGKGRLTNGVASRYLFFIRTHQGGYEYINITSLYYRMEKKRIWQKKYYLLSQAF